MSRPSRQSSRDTETSRPLRLLSLDGGGVRGLSELLILQSMMDKVAWDLKLTYTPRPCEYFDLIGGTSTGGIIAVLLGRLRLSVDECLDIYSELSEQVFATQRFGNGRGIIRSRYDHTILERVIKEKLVQVQDEKDTVVVGAKPACMSQGANEMMKDNHSDICRTFVTATPANDVRTSHPSLFRTYDGRKNAAEDQLECEIWKALRATSAAPTFFDPIEINGLEYVDGGFGCNNPVLAVYEEAQAIWPGRNIGCIVSIGTGIPKVQTVDQIPSLCTLNFGEWGRTVLGWVDVLQRVATDCNIAHDDMTRRFMGKKKYFRFNVQQGAQFVPLDAWEQLPNLAVHTEA